MDNRLEIILNMDLSDKATHEVVNFMSIVKHQVDTLNQQAIEGFEKIKELQKQKINIDIEIDKLESEHKSHCSNLDAKREYASCLFDQVLTTLGSYKCGSITFEAFKKKMEELTNR